MLYPHYKVKIEDPDSGRRCAAHEIGEICVKGPFKMIRYLNRPKETENYFDFEGFAHTGDLGYFTSEGDLVHVNPLKK